MIRLARAGKCGGLTTTDALLKHRLFAPNLPSTMPKQARQNLHRSAVAIPAIHCPQGLVMPMAHPIQTYSLIRHSETHWMK